MDLLQTWLYDKAPFHLPDGVREFIVKFGPWVLVVFLVLSLPAILIMLGIGSLAVPFAGVGYAGGFGIAAAGSIANLVLTVMALPGLFARQKAGWTWLLYSEFVSIATSLLLGNIFSALIGGTIALYLMFQVRSYYK
jgi:hypothetical protein